jgi:hypothetical protein
MITYRKACFAKGLQDYHTSLKGKTYKERMNSINNKDDKQSRLI